MDPESKRDISDDKGDDGDSKKISAAQYKIFRQAVSTSKGSFKLNPAKTKRLCWTWVIWKLPTESHG